MSRLSVEPWAAAVDLLEYELATQEDWRETSPDIFNPDAGDCDPSDHGDRAW